MKRSRAKKQDQGKGADVWARVDEAVERIEKLVTQGHTGAALAIRSVVELRSMAREFSDGETMAGIALRAVESLLDALEAVGAQAVVPTDAFVQRARVLCADLLELSMEPGIDHWNQQEVGRCRDEARALLTGERTPKE
jgi:uncharacterized protein YoaH (UPF0181 family)